MAKLSLSTKCECGHVMEAEIKTPTWTTPMVKKLNCKGCASIYLVTCTRVRSERGERLIRSEFKIVEISPELRELKGNPGIATKLKRQADKITGKNALNEMLLTSLDECEPG